MEARDATGRIISAGRSLFNEALDLVDSCAAVVSDRLVAMGAHRPAEVEMQLAVKVDGKVGARIVELVLRWKLAAPDG